LTADSARPILRHALTSLAVLTITLVGCGSPSAFASPTAAEARAELRRLVEDVTTATASRYGLTDDRGNVMDGAKVIAIPEAGAFGAVYHTWSASDAAFHVHLATSTDLIQWTWRREFGREASQPTIAAASDGGYVLAWEQQPDPIHLVIAYYASWDDLVAARSARRIDPPVSTPACGEGTPSIESATRGRVEVAFHYHADCTRDREAGGSTDWTTWQASTRPALDQALLDIGVMGSHGDRDRITFRGHDFTLIEGQLVQDDWKTFRVSLYDDASGRAELLDPRTHAGSTAFANPTIGQVEIDGHQAIVVTLFIPQEGARGHESGELIYYRTIPDEPGSHSKTSNWSAARRDGESN
jgi:hypothetical protein